MRRPSPLAIATVDGTWSSRVASLAAARRKAPRVALRTGKEVAVLVRGHAWAVVSPEAAWRHLDAEPSPMLEGLRVAAFLVGAVITV